MSECQITPEGESHCEVDVSDEPVVIEVTVPAPKAPSKPWYCNTWDRVRHRRSDESNKEFLEKYPECR